MGRTTGGHRDRMPRGRRGRRADLASEVLGRLQRVLPRPVDGWVPERPESEPDLDRGVGRSGRAADVDSEVSTDGGADSPFAIDAERPFAIDVGTQTPEPVPRRVRLVPAGRAVAGLALLVALAVVTALVALWLARPREEPLPARAQLVGSPVQSTPDPSVVAGSTAPSATAPSATAPSTGVSVSPGAAAGTVLVHVAGAVHRPGVVELAAGARVADAVDAAGGVTRRAATSSVNLARPVVDGEQVVVLRKGEAGADPASAPGGAPAATGTSSGAAAAGPVDLNTATLEQLDALPGIGPVLAQRILDWRTAHGRFTAVDELGEVSGIGEATLADLRPVVRV